MTTTTNDAAPVPIISAGLSDIFRLSRLEKACFCRDDAWPLIELFGVLTFPETVRLKMDRDGEMIAFLAGDRRNQEKTAWIITIAVAPRWRGKGLGSHLLQAGEKALAMERVRLTTRASNKDAIRLYERSGYTQIDCWHRYYAGGEDGLVFEKVFKQ